MFIDELKNVPVKDDELEHRKSTDRWIESEFVKFIKKECIYSAEKNKREVKGYFSISLGSEGYLYDLNERCDIYGVDKKGRTIWLSKQKTKDSNGWHSDPFIFNVISCCGIDNYKICRMRDAIKELGFVDFEVEYKTVLYIEKKEKIETTTSLLTYKEKVKRKVSFSDVHEIKDAIFIQIRW